MIPTRIELEGFLCYRDKQVIDLEGCELWVFSGRNGSGKSAVFDAMTYALFKAHRGGKSGAANLIHSDADGFAISFEFDLGGSRYRLRRSLRRTGKAERQLFRRSLINNAEQWPAVPDTDTDTGLQDWIEQNVGLTFETFTASVLLMQGRADCLISSSPKERHAILAGIVDLARYEELHRHADRRRIQRKAELEFVQNQLRSHAEIEPSVLEIAERETEAAEQARAEAETAWETSIQSEEQAKTWRDLVVQREKAIAQRDHSRKIMQDSERIARDWRRLQDLDAILPALRHAFERHERIERAEAQACLSHSQISNADRKLDLLAILAEDNRTFLDATVDERTRVETRKSDIIKQGTAIAEAVQRAKTARGHRDEIDRLTREIAAYADDLPSHVEILETKARDQDAWKAALPLLRNLVRDRNGLRSSRLAVTHGQQKAQRAQGRLADIEPTLEPLSRALSKATTAESDARDRLTKATTLRDAIQSRVETFQELRGESSCDRCGQPLTAEHYTEESNRLQTDRHRANKVVETAERDHGLIVESRAKAQTELGNIQRDVEEARKEINQAKIELDRAEADSRTFEGNCRDHYAAIVSPFQQKIAAETPNDWLTTVFPSPDDLEDGRRHEVQIPTTQDALTKLKKDLQEVSGLKARRQQESDALARVVLQPDDETAEARRERLADEYRAIDALLRSHALDKTLAEETRELLSSQANALSKERAEADKHLATQSLLADTWREEARSALATITETWRTDFEAPETDRIVALSAEAETLRKKGTEALAAQLPRAQIEERQAKTTVEAIDRQCDQIPGAIQPAADEASSRTAIAMTERNRAEAYRRNKEVARDNLRRTRDRREELASEMRSAASALSVAETLAKLLGRDGLQRDLLREAEHGILDRANPILGEISGGELQLRLMDGDADPNHALPLEAVVRTHGRTNTHDVAYLSASQKFRVAVSLALAIGQFARGKKERPIESVIIDEGFGCLDRQGRDEMIAQLNNLKGRLARIILVSHQEDFVDAFADSYRFEVIDRATVVEPFHR